MKTTLIAAAILTAGASLASAADMRMPTKALLSPVPAYNWTGFYVGANVGYSWGDASTDGVLTGTQNVSVFRTASATLISSTTTSLGTFPYSLGRVKANGIIGGGQAGYNWQTDRWVLGVEGDFQASDERGGSTVCIATCAANVTVTQRLNWFGTLRGRVGWLATDRIMLYATGGLAYGNLDTRLTSGVVGLGNTPVLGSSSTRAGWTVGAGVEGAIDRNWTAKLEYLYMDLGSFPNATSNGTFVTNAANTPGIDLNTVTTTTITNTVATRFTDHVLRGGVNYRF